MAQTLGRLTALQVTRINARGLHSDGGGLYLQVSREGAKSWIYRFARGGVTRDMGLGSLKAISLQAARTLAADCRAKVATGIDPIEAREAAQLAAALNAAKSITFKEASRRFIAAMSPGWTNPKHRAQWSATLTAYAFPVIGDVTVQDVSTDLILRILQPIWETKRETASRLRGRIEQVLDWARAHGHRTGENPARWRGNLKHLLAKRATTRRHHPAMPYAEIPAFVAKLHALPGVSARALIFTILTASRTTMTIEAVRDEIDRTEKVWTVPADRMKNKIQHRVPLSGAALAIVRATDPQSPFLFPGRKSNTGLSNMAMLKLLEAMGRDDVTVHGFRSSFRDWVSEETDFSGEVAEMALAHIVSDDTEAAYRRGELFKKRQKLMQAWADYCFSKVSP